MSGVFVRATENHTLAEWSEPTRETRAAGLSAAELVRGEQAGRLFALLVRAFPDGLSNNELSRQSGVRINAVTARMIEFRRVELPGQELLVEACAKRRDDYTGVENVVWRVNPSYFEPSRRVVMHGEARVCEGVQDERGGERGGPGRVSFREVQREP